MKNPAPIIVKITDKTAVVIRLSTFKDVEKVYIQGGYVPGEDFEGDLMIEPCKEWPSGLSFGKAVTFQPGKMHEVTAAIVAFAAALPYKKKPTNTAPTPATPTKTKKHKGTVLASNAVMPKAEPEEEAEDSSF